ncbi:MAG: glycoside hydrolase family 38 C-terminal domain-containing protein [Bacteroidota bacterium]
MKLFKMIILFCCLPLLLNAQPQPKPPTNVDKLITVMDSLTMAAFDNWKVSPDIKNPSVVSGDPTQPVYDDSKWDVLKIGQNIYPDSVWLRKEIVLPDKILGQPVSGRVRFLVSVDDYGYLWVNGESKGYFPWDGEFELTKDAKPGQKFSLVIKAINTGGPLRLLRAQIESDLVKPIRQSVQDLSVSLMVGQKLLSFDTYQTSSNKKEDPGIDKSAMDKAEKIKLNALLQDIAGKVDVPGMMSGSIDKFNASVDMIKTELKPIGEFAKRYTLYFDANAHIDAAWLWRDKETIEVCKNTFTSVLKMMDSRPDFTYTQSSAAYYDWMERLYPEVFSGIQKRVKDGRWEVTGGMWIEPDCNLPSGESWARQLLYAKRYFKNKLGADVKIGWNPDSFGYNWNMPLFYSNAGIDAFITQKIGWNDTNVFPYRLFWWSAPDDSKILCYFPFDYVNTVDDPYRLVDWLRQFEANTGFTKLMILFGVGDHGGGPSDEMIDRIERLKSLPVYPNIEYGNTTDYLKWLKSRDLSSVPTWDDELYLEYHQGTYTTQANMKELNRKSEILLTNAEKFSTLSTMFGGKYHNADLEDAWRDVLFNQFHDILPGSGIRENYIDATEKYDNAMLIGNHELNRSLKAVASQVNTSSIKKGTPLFVFNPLAWTRTDIVKVQLPEEYQGEYGVFDKDGKQTTSQIVPTGKYTRELLFTATNVPSLGYATYELRAIKTPVPNTELIITNGSLENQFFKVTVDSSTGWVKSITDKRNGKELLSGSADELQLLEDKPAQWDAWNVGLTGVQYPWKVRRIEIVEQGPLRCVLRVVRDYLKPGEKKEFPTFDYPNTFCTQDIMLYSGVDRIDFKTDIDWWEQKTMLKASFPVAIQDSVATYEIPYGSIARSTRMNTSWEKAKVEVPAGRWADLSSGGYGVSLLNKSKYGYDIKGNTMRLSLLRSPKWPDPTADRGKHSIEYSLYPHTGNWRTGNTVRRAYEYNDELIALLGSSHKGKLPAERSFVELAPANLVLTTVKKAEDSNAWIYQWYDAGENETEATLTMPQTPKQVVLSNFLEDDGAPVPFDKNIVKVKTKKNGLVTLKVTY